MRSVFTKTLCAVAVLAMALGCAGYAGSREQAAKFGDTVIYEDEVAAYTQQFRDENGLGDDASWAQYLSEQNLVSSSWRESAIRTLAEQELVKQRAAELGIVADAEKVESSLAQAKADAGVAQGDDAAWTAALEQKGTTEAALREKYEYASIEQQVLKADLEDKVASDTALVQEYIDRYLMDIVTRRYSLIYFASDAKADAKAALDELSKVEASELPQRFAAQAKELSADRDSAKKSGDIGWDVQYNHDELDPGNVLVKLEPGELAGRVVKVGDSVAVALCTDKFTFSKDTTPDSIPDESLRSWVTSAATTANWAGARSAYLSELVDNAKIQVHAAPADMPYNVDELVGAAQDEGDGT